VRLLPATIAIAVALALASTAACGGPSTLRGQMDQAERQGQKADEDMDQAEKAIKALDVDKADTALKSARARLQDPNMAKYPEHKMLDDRLKRDTDKLEAAREEVRKRELERAVAAKKAEIDVAWSKVEPALEAAGAETAVAADIEAARTVLKDVKDKLDAGADLEKRDEGFSSYLDSMRKRVQSGAAAVKKDENSIAFRDGPLASRKAGSELADQLSSEKDAKKREALSTTAIEKFRSCADQSAQLISGTPEMAKAKVSLDGKKLSIDAIGADCRKKADALSKALARKQKNTASASKKKQKKKHE
jgi:hypothetical protein